MSKKKKLNIKKAIKKPGALRKALGIKKGKLGQRARFAKTLRKLSRRKA